MASGAAASPLAVTVLAEFFKLQPQKAMRLAGLIREAPEQSTADVLSVAAYAKPSFDSLTAEEKMLFHEFVKWLQKKG